MNPGCHPPSPSDTDSFISYLDNLQAHEQDETQETERCMECQKPSRMFDSTMLQTFQLHVCVSCKSLNADGKFRLVTKTAAKSDYLLPESTLRNLPFLIKDNPKNHHFAPLKLYVVHLLEEAAFELFNGKEAFEQEKAARRAKRYDKVAKRTKGLLSKSDKVKKKLKTSRSVELAGDTNYVPLANRDHKHAYENEVYDDDKKCWVKSCPCGIQVCFQKL